MKIIAWFTVGLTKGSPELCRELLTLYPDGQRWTLPAADGSRQGYFECNLPEGHPTLGKLLTAVERHGYKLWAGRGRATPQDIRFKYRRIYEDSDFQSAVLLQPQPHAYVGTADRNSEGLLLLDPEAKFVKKGRNGLMGFDFGFTVTISLIVSSDLRRKFESLSFQRLLFKPILSEHSPDYGPIPEYWELTGDYIMPPLANPDLDEGFYTPSEFHYRAADLSGADDFDFALTKENLVENWPYPVVSQRFYRFCVEQKLPMAWEPVRIDPAE